MRFLLKASVPALLIALALLTSSCTEKCDCLEFIEESPVGYVSTTMDGKITFTNAAYRKMLGYDEGEISNLTYQQLTPEKWRAIEQAYVDAAEHMNFVRFEKEYIKKDGNVIPVQVTGWLIRDNEDKPIGTASFVVNMTGHVKSEDLADMMGLGND